LIVHRIAKALLQAGVDGRAEVGEGRHASPWTHPNEGLRGIVIHRAKKRGHSDGFGGEPPIAEAELAQIADESSQAGRRAAEAERELMEWKKVRFMQDRVGEDFAALVLNPTKYGFFVELTELFVEGWCRSNRCATIAIRGARIRTRSLANAGDGASGPAI